MRCSSRLAFPFPFPVPRCPPLPFPALRPSPEGAFLIWQVLVASVQQAHLETPLFTPSVHTFRAHFLFTPCLRTFCSQAHLGTGVCKTAQLFIADLAGSENLSRSGSTGERARETGHINKSLFALGNVCEALYHNAKAEQAGRRPERHIPFRDSKLTHLCQV